VIWLLVFVEVVIANKSGCLAVTCMGEGTTLVDHDRWRRIALAEIDCIFWTTIRAREMNHFTADRPIGSCRMRQC
jgi:hypothetical protein